MTSAALGLVLLAALGHATWNALAKSTPGGAVVVWLFNAVALVAFAPIAVAALVYDSTGAGWTMVGAAALSGCLHSTYYVLLQRGYRTGDLSLVYPLARGTGPLFATAGAIVLLGEHPSALALCGTAAIALGVVVLLGPVRAHAAHARRAAAYATLTGVLIGAYTLWDAHAVTALGAPPLPYLWCSTLAICLALTPVALRRRGEVRELWRTRPGTAISVGVLSQAAYALVLVALTLSPVSYVAPAREVSILLGAAFGVTALDEGHGRRRLAAAAAIVAGVIALAVG